MSYQILYTQGFSAKWWEVRGPVSSHFGFLVSGTCSQSITKDAKLAIIRGFDLFNEEKKIIVDKS